MVTAMRKISLCHFLHSLVITASCIFAAKRRHITHHIFFEEKMLKENLKDLVNSAKWKYVQMINIISV
jgi:hypothetical protein